jgi:hypothetical protein
MLMSSSMILEKAYKLDGGRGLAFVSIALEIDS